MRANLEVRDVMLDKVNPVNLRDELERGTIKAKGVLKVSDGAKAKLALTQRTTKGKIGRLAQIYHIGKVRDKDREDLDPEVVLALAERAVLGVQVTTEVQGNG